MSIRVISGVSGKCCELADFLCQFRRYVAFSSAFRGKLPHVLRRQAKTIFFCYPFFPPLGLVLTGRGERRVPAREAGGMFPADRLVQVEKDVLFGQADWGHVAACLPCFTDHAIDNGFHPCWGLIGDHSHPDSQGSDDLAADETWFGRGELQEIVAA